MKTGFDPTASPYTEYPLPETDLFDREEEEEEQREYTPLYEHFSIRVDKGQTPLRIDKFLADKMSGISRTRIAQAAEAGTIFVNEIPVKANYKVKPDDYVSLRLARPPYEFTIIKENIPLDIVYEDTTLMVINKPAGLVVHPGHGNYTGTLLNAIAYHMRNTPEYDPEDPRLGLVHRIDKDTSGLLVVAKTPEVKAALSRQFFEKTTRRRYEALVWGRPQPTQGTIRTNLARDPRDRMQMATFPYEGEIGKTAVTHYRTLTCLGYVTHIECVLETGRTHQIRAHMKSIGHPLFNDVRYGGDQVLRGNHFSSYKKFVDNAFSLCPRQALHARSLGFFHPIKQEEMDFEAPLPDDMRLLIDKWERYVQRGDLEPLEYTQPNSHIE